jgi:DNA-binding response OmpR family regulator
MTANTILVVESEILVRQPLSQYLRDCGYSVIETASGEEARQAFSNGKLRIDVALIDVHSPTESGFALSAWIRSHFPDVELMLAGTVAKALQSAGDLCDESPAAGKPADYKPVLDHIRRLLANRKATIAKDEPDTI